MLLKCERWRLHIIFRFVTNSKNDSDGQECVCVVRDVRYIASMTESVTGTDKI